MPSDDRAPSTQESTADVIKASTANMPAFMQAMIKELGPTERGKLAAAQDVSPAWAKLTSDLYRQFAPGMAQTGSEIDRANRLSAGRTDAEILGTSGRDLSRIYKEIDTELNPEYYATRKAGADSIASLLKSINLDDASPEAERLINQENIRTGNVGNNSATNTVANALSFGSEMSGRRAQLSNAINTASAFLQPSSNSAFNPATAALSRPTGNTGLSEFSGVTKAGGEAFGAGQGLLGQIGGIKQAEMGINANRRDTLDRINETMSSLPSV